MTGNLPRLMLAAPASGSGKTTVTCALLRSLVRRGLRTASFKCGPDYIDPMFHRKAVGAFSSSNLDLFLSNGQTAKSLFAERAANAEISVIEGVMGFYDGISCTTEASSYDVAKLTETPVVLIINCRGMAASIAAQVKGFTEYCPASGVKAVILNQISASLYSDVKQQVEETCGVRVMGYLPPLKDAMLESRHLGLVTADEIHDIQQKLDFLSDALERTVDIPCLIELACTAPPILAEKQEYPSLKEPVYVAIAYDEAFSFYYEENLSLLEQMGAQLIRFSPMRDKKLPKTDGILLGGGYPELYARPLSENQSMRESVRRAFRDGMPVIAECGGFLYLHRTLEDVEGNRFPMVGAIAADACKTQRLRRFGYQILEAEKDNLLCMSGGRLPAHEFHYWESSDSGNAFVAQKPKRQAQWQSAHAGKTFYAGFPHFYFPGCPEAAWRFLKACLDYKRGQGQ